MPPNTQKRPLLTRARDVWNTSNANSAYLIANAIVPALIGLVFLKIAFGLFPTSAIGIATSLVTLTAFLSLISRLGLDASMLQYLPRLDAPNQVKYVNSALLLTALSSTCLAALFLLLAPMVSGELSILRDQPLLQISFVACLIALTWNAILDFAFASQLAGRRTFLKNTLASALRIPAAFGLIFLSPVLGVYSSYALAYSTACIIGILILVPMTFPSFKLQMGIDRNLLLTTFDFSRTSLLVNLVGPYQVTAGLFAMANLVVLHFYGSQTVAYFFVATTVMAFFYVIPLSIATTVTAEAAGKSSEFARLLRRSVIFAFACLVGEFAVLYVTADYALALLSASLASQGKTLILILCGSTVGSAFGAFYVADLRVREANVELAVFVFGTAALTIVLMLIAGFRSWSITGAGIAFAIGQAVTGMIALVRLWPTLAMRPIQSGRANAREDSR